MMKKSLKLMLVALFGVVMGLSFASCSSNNDDNVDGGGTTPPVQQKAKYTIMFYGCAGGNLDGWYESAIPGILKALNVPSNQVRFAVMFNTSKDASEYGDEVPDFIGDWATCYRYELTPQTDFSKAGYRAKYKYKNASEVPLYKTATLVEYINWVKQNVPAENYIFMPMNHGGGLDLSEEVTRAIGYDDNHPNPAKKDFPYGIGERAIADALQQTNTHLKAIYWCGCMMGQMEVLTELAPYCDYQFSSSHVSRAIPALIYDIINAINSSPDDFEKAAQIDGQYKDADYNQYFVNVQNPKKKGELHNENCDWACWRSSKLADINAQMKKLATLVCEGYGDATKKAQIDAAMAKTYVLEYDCYFVDALDFAVNLAERLDEGQNATANQIVTDLESALNAAKIYRLSYANIVNRLNEKIAPKKGYFSLGVSVYPYDDLKWVNYGQNYKANAFDKATGWSKYLDMNTVAINESGTNPANNSTYDLGYLAE